MDAQSWAAESYSLSRTKVYKPPIGSELGPFALDEFYLRTVNRITAQRAELAGIRLAKVLNTDLR
jgi:hypothetical protein